MKCRNCGASIPEGMMICPDCMTEVQMVPDYNPLEDVLTREVKGSVEDATRPIRTDDIRRYRDRTGQENVKSTRVLSQTELDRIRADRMKKRKMARKKQLAKKRRRMVIIILLVILAIAGIGGYVYYQNSYAGLINRGNQALGAGEYSAAENYFERAINKDSRKAEAYTGLANVYLQQDDQDEAENILLSAIDSQPENGELYLAAIQFYQDTDQLDKISALLEGCNDSVLEVVSDYVSESPVFSLDEGTYTEVQEVSLSGDGDIYYTTDGSEPSSSSTLYTEPILLNEGTTIIKAICINENGVPSLSDSRTYTVEIPIANAPAISPSTGQYTTAQQITIDVPEGYTAYYTTDGTTPTTSSTVYTGPVEMPEGQTIFSAILVSDSGKATGVTKRNYILTYE